MENRFRKICLFIGFGSIASFGIMVASGAGLIPSAAAAVPGLIVAGVLYLLAPMLAKHRGPPVAEPAKPKITFTIHQQLQFVALLVGLILMMVGGGVGVLIHRPLWLVHSVGLAVTLALLATFLVSSILPHFKSELKAVAADKSEDSGARAISRLGRMFLFIAVGLGFLNSNTFLDRSPAEEEKVLLVDRHVTNSDRRRPEHYVYLGTIRGGGFSGIPESTRLQVSAAIYPDLEPGISTAILRIKRGLWHLPWIQSVEWKNRPRPSGHDSSEAARALIEEARRERPPPFRPADSYRTLKWPNGQVKERAPLVDGKEEGIARYWHANGQLYAEIPWRNGQKDGHFKLYREDGILEQDLMYKTGKPHGLLRWYKNDGTLDQEAFYLEGERR